jgi:hypothetical protein
MQSAELREQTASEPLTLVQEFEMQGKTYASGNPTHNNLNGYFRELETG